MRSNYWSCSKFADWVRGTAKISAGTSKQWREWENEAKTLHPIRYWIVEEGLDYLQNFVNWPADRLNDVRYYINNRWVSRTHGLTSNLEKGRWHEFDTRLLHSMFDELVNFVEIEQAWHHVVWDKDAQKRFETPWWRKGWLRWRTWRCPDAGVEYLVWASGLKIDDSMGVSKGDENFGEPTQQAIGAREILELYRWWKIERPKRQDPYEVSGWHDICDRRREKGQGILWEDDSDTEKEESKKSLDTIHNLELQYEQEDEAMMIRLIKIRRSLWT